MFSRSRPAAHRNLRAYRRAHQLDAALFWRTRQFPATERHALTRQLRRATHALLRSIERAWENRYHPSAFHGHLTHALGTCVRTRLWLELAHECQYLPTSAYADLVHQTDAVERQLRRLQQQRIPLLAGPEQPTATAQSYWAD